MKKQRPEFRDERGLLWPNHDVECANVLWKQVEELKMFYKYIPEDRFGVCVQAGGNCGLYPMHLADKFKTVYTIEPDRFNFTALAWNTFPLANVVKIQAVLGDKPGLVRTEEPASERNNCGAYWVAKDETGIIPTLRIDDFGLPVCDFICLDVEGYEHFALKGATDTITRCKPVIVIEDKSISERYGIAKGETASWLIDTFGYRAAYYNARDVLLTPA